MIRQVTSFKGATHAGKVDLDSTKNSVAKEKLERAQGHSDFASNSASSRLGKASLTGEGPARTPTQAALLSMPLENVQLLDVPAALQLRARVKTQLDPFSAENAASTNAWLHPENVRLRYATLFGKTAAGTPDTTAPVWSFTGLVRDGLGAAAEGKPGVAAQRFKGALDHLNEVHRVSDLAQLQPALTWVKLVTQTPELAEVIRPEGMTHVQELQASLLKLLALSLNADRIINGASTPSRAAAARSFEAERSLAVRFGSDTIDQLMSLERELDKHLANATPAPDVIGG